MRAVVTGASAGIGKALAIELAQNGYDLVLIARRGEILAELQTDLQRTYPEIKVAVITADLAREAEIKKVIAAVTKTEIHLFFNNAGVGYLGPLLEQDTERVHQMLTLLTTAVTLFTREIGAHMAKHGGGTIINIASVVAYNSVFPGNAVYAAAKRYVWDFSRAVNYENQKRRNHVRVVAVLPGAIATAWQQNALPTTPSASGPVAKIKASSVTSCARTVVRQVLDTRKTSITVGKFGFRLKLTRWMPRALVAPLSYRWARRFGGF